MAPPLELLREGVELEVRGDAGLAVLDRTLGVEHMAPPAVAGALERMRSAASGSSTTPTSLDAVRAWLASRFLSADDASREVVAWELEAAPPLPPAAALSIEMAEGSRWRCHGCGACCETVHPGPVSPAERDRILHERAFLERGWPGIDPRGFFVREADPTGRESYSLALVDGRCVFLGDDKLCRIHKEVGPEVKPSVCRAFPLAATLAPQGIRVWLRASCESRARSLDPAEGDPLAAQAAWIADVLREAEPPRVPRLVEVSAGRFWPSGLARAVLARATSLVRRAPDARAAPQLVRDVVYGVAGALPESLDGASARFGAELAASGPLEALRQARGPLDPRRGFAALRALLLALLPATSDSVATRARDLSGAAKMARSDAAYLDAVGSLLVTLGDRLQWPATSLPPELDAEALRQAAAASPADDAPDVVAFVRDVWAQQLFSLRPLMFPGGLFAALGRLTLEHLLARQWARLAAAREGRPRARAEDWNLGFAAVERMHMRTAFDEHLTNVLAAIGRDVAFLPAQAP